MDNSKSVETETLSASNIHLSFGRIEVLQDVSFHIDQGEILSIIGPNVPISWKTNASGELGARRSRRVGRDRIHFDDPSLLLRRLHLEGQAQGESPESRLPYGAPKDPVPFRRLTVRLF